jgi:hypothetical protein
MSDIFKESKCLKGSKCQWWRCLGVNVLRGLDVIDSKFLYQEIYPQTYSTCQTLLNDTLEIIFISWIYMNL